MDNRGATRPEPGHQPHDGASETTPLLDGDGPRRVPDEEAADDPTPGSALAAPGEEEETVVADEISTAKTTLILGTAYVGVFFGAIDASIIATLSAPIASEFKSLSLMSWLATAYLIANSACQPISGRLTDIFGRGPGLIFSNIFFAAGNLICGLAGSDGVIILGRVVAGIGGGGLMSISTFLASDLVPLRKRGLVQGIGNIAYGSGAMLGGVFGGFVNDNSAWGWRLAFLVQVPVSLVSAVLVFALVKVPPRVSNRSYLARIDFVGAFFIVSFLVLLLLGLNAGGNLVPWTHPLVLSTLPVSLLTFVGFIVWESRSKQPILPVRLLTHRTILTGCLANFFCTMALMMTVFYIPLYLQVLGYSASDAGLRLLFSPLGVSVSSIGCGLVMKRTGRYFALGIAALLLFCAGFVAATTLDSDSPVWVPFLVFFLLGAGYGAMLTVTLLACIAAVDQSQQAVITSATYAFRSVGGTVGITAASAAYQNILKRRLWERFGGWPGAAEEIARIRDDLGEIRRLPQGWYPGVIASFMEAFRGVWLTALGLSVLALVCVSLMREHTLHATLSRR